MKEGYKALGEFIRQIDIRNTEGKEDNLLGVSVQKQFIPSIANTVGTDFTKSLTTNRNIPIGRPVRTSKQICKWI